MQKQKKNMSGYDVTYWDGMFVNVLNHPNQVTRIHPDGGVYFVFPHDVSDARWGFYAYDGDMYKSYNEMLYLISRIDDGSHKCKVVGDPDIVAAVELLRKIRPRNKFGWSPSVCNVLAAIRLGVGIDVIESVLRGFKKYEESGDVPCPGNFQQLCIDAKKSKIEREKYEEEEKKETISKEELWKQDWDELEQMMKQQMPKEEAIESARQCENWIQLRKEEERKKQERAENNRRIAMQRLLEVRRKREEAAQQEKERRERIRRNKEAAMKKLEESRKRKQQLTGCNSGTFGNNRFVCFLYICFDF